MVPVELERIEALELLGMTLAHLSDAESTGELSPRVPMLMAIRDKLAAALEETDELHRGPGRGGQSGHGEVSW